MGNAAKRPSVWRRARVSDLRLRRARGVRLAALAGVSGVLLLPPPTSAHAVLLDAIAPIVAYSIDGIVGTNGWYRGNASGNFVVVHWSVSDPDSRVISSTGCEPAIQIPGPNRGYHAHVLATSRRRHHHRYTTKAIKIDATPPAVTGAPARAPDSNGWYNQAGRGLVLRNRRDLRRRELFGTTYAGPDNASAQVSGTCTDVAGNVGSAALALAYDATPPQLLKLQLQACQARRRPQLGGLRRHAARAGDAIARARAATERRRSCTPARRRRSPTRACESARSTATR